MNVFSLCDILKTRREELSEAITDLFIKQGDASSDARLQAEIDMAKGNAELLEELTIFTESFILPLACSKFWQCLFNIEVAAEELQETPIFDVRFPVLLKEVQLFLYKTLPYFRA